PVERDWPLAVRLLVQAAILAVVVGAWELAADAGLIDAFFWSKPSEIWAGLVIFIVDGEGWTDVRYTVEATLWGFAIGTALGGARWWGCRSGGRATTRRSCSPSWSASRRRRSWRWRRWWC